MQYSNLTKTTNPVHVLCTCEGVPAVFRFTIPSEKKAIQESAPTAEILPLNGNPLDVAIVSGSLLVSVDNIHEPGSLDLARLASNVVSRLQLVDFGGVGHRKQDESDFAGLNGDLGMEMTGDATELKSLSDLVYGMESMRKRGNEDT